MSIDHRERHWAEVRARYAAVARAVREDPGHDSVRAETSAATGSYPAEDLESVPRGASQAAFGCGNPVAVADLHGGDVVLDLGSGAGLDVILSARRVGPDGLAFGLDMTEEMLALARANAREAGVRNAVFLRGLIEDIPLPAHSADVVISNCVVNLSPDKDAVFTEVARVLRPGGRIGVADVLVDERAGAERNGPDAGAGGAPAADAGENTGSGAAGAGVAPGTACAAGALTEAAYRSVLARAGLCDVEIRLTHPVSDVLRSAIIRARTSGPGPARGGRASVASRGAVTVEPMRPEHWPSVAAIYAAGIATGGATFETEVPDWPAWDHAHLPGHRLVAMVGGTPAGWAALAPVSARCVYAGVAENSVYVAEGHRGAGVGRALLRALIDSAERDGIWTIQTGIFPENEASLALHRACGFRVVGRRERLGRLGGRWRDVMFLERRSPRLR